MSQQRPVPGTKRWSRTVAMMARVAYEQYPYYGEWRGLLGKPYHAMLLENADNALRQICLPRPLEKSARETGDAP